jgi:hypothetical protein
MSPFKSLYGLSYRTPLSWSESGERVIFDPIIRTEAEETARQIHANILIAQSHQKSYNDKRCRVLEFEVGDHIYLQVSPMKGVRGFGIKGKLAPHYIGLYPTLEKYGPLAYQVELPSRLFGVHNVFHVSQLKRCLKPPMNVVIEDNIPLEPDLTYKCYLTKVLDQQDRATRKKTIRFYKVQWSDHSEDEATSKHEDYLRSNYPDFLPSSLKIRTSPRTFLSLKSQDEISFKGGGL